MLTLAHECAIAASTESRIGAEGVAESLPPTYVVALVRRVRFSDGIACPRCGARHVHRWGHVRQRRRYRCLTCQRTFSDLTGTPLAYLKHLEPWSRFCTCTLLGLSLRRTAAQLGLHKDTAFRWRHRLLAGLLATEHARLRGTITISETCFAYSQKGQRNLGRPPRRRAFRGLTSRITTAPVSAAPGSTVSGRVLARGVVSRSAVASSTVPSSTTPSSAAPSHTVPGSLVPAVRVLLACDEHGNGAAEVLSTPRRPRPDDIARLLHGHLPESRRSPQFAKARKDPDPMAPARENFARHASHGRSSPRGTQSTRCKSSSHRTELTSRDGRLGPVARFARIEGLAWRRRGPQDAAAVGGRDPGFLYTRRLKDALARFRGVATRYLTHYLVWFRLIERASHATGTVSLSPFDDSLLTGSFP